MATEEYREEERAMPAGEMIEREETDTTVVNMPHTARIPAWHGRISWSSVMAGVFAAIAIQLVLGAFGTVVGLGHAATKDIAGLLSASTTVGTWTAISVIVAMIAGGYIASRLAEVRYASNGLWHGMSVWAVTLTIGFMLGALGVPGLLGYTGTALEVARLVVPATAVVGPRVLEVAEIVAFRIAGYFLLGSLAGLVAALLGGWLGSRRVTVTQTLVSKAEAEHRRVA